PWSLSLLRTLRSLCTPNRAQRNEAKRPARRANRYRPMFEALEDRVTPTVTVGFDSGTGTLGVFNNTANETIAFAHPAADTLTINTTASTIALGGSFPGFTLSNGNKTLTI